MNHRCRQALDESMHGAGAAGTAAVHTTAAAAAAAVDTTAVGTTAAAAGGLGGSSADTVAANLGLQACCCLNRVRSAGWDTDLN